MRVISTQLDLEEVRRFGRYALVGFSGTLVDFTLLTLLKLVGLPTLPANTISYGTGILNNFFWNRRWTFSQARDKAWQTQLYQFFTVSLVGMAVNDFVVMLLIAPFQASLGYWGYLPAKLIATAIALTWNFTANRLWTFRTLENDV